MAIVIGKGYISIPMTISNVIERKFSFRSPFVLLSLTYNSWHSVYVCWLIVVLAESGRPLLHSQGTCGATSALRLVFSHKVALPYHKVVVHHRFNIPSIRTLMLHHRPCL